MDTKKLGIELARLIEETVNLSMDDICSALGKSVGDVFFEYIALLLWVVTKEASIILPEKSIQPTIDTMTCATFYLIEDSGAKSLKDFNEKIWEDFILSRFGLYHSAWHAWPTKVRGEIEDKDVLLELSQVTVAHNFVLCCLTKTADLHKANIEFRKHPNYKGNYPTHIGCALKHYRRFSERAKSVLSRI